MIKEQILNSRSKEPLGPTLKFDLEFEKQSFLSKYKSPKTGKYKRYLGAPIRYAGGKSLAVGYIIELLPTHINKVVSPFIGGGSVEVALAKELNLEVVGYDIFDILVNFWQVLLERPGDLYDRLKEFKPTKECYYKNKEILKSHWEGKIRLDPLELAAQYFFNHNLSYGPGFLGWTSEIYLREDKYQKMIEKLRDFHVPKLKVFQGDFKDVIPRHQNDFLYLDPPYYLKGDSKMFKGIYPQRNFPIHHNNFDHALLKDLLKNHKGGFILSYNDCHQIREWYKEYQIFKPSWQYTMGQGETRIGLNRIRNGSNHIKESHELLIYKPPE
ncbi:MAG: DNA adenine methylase [Chlorobi bacterium]|nr:DNA adenine methylase [Chlorobiota bacterium]